ncbi:MAG: metalloregulator ArsR/SmtB family transcription factor, partial [Nitrospirota bacterium]|nr:metalloregulator ArsR/SmtB family transcription factor [Nitrospirota bacterium]
ATLREGEKSVQEIERVVGTTQSNISQHLSVLRDKDILSYRKEGNQVFYMIANRKVIQLLELMQEIFCPGM